jgi:hypothetical protein
VSEVVVVADTLLPTSVGQRRTFWDMNKTVHHVPVEKTETNLVLLRQSLKPDLRHFFSTNYLLLNAQ